MKKIILPLVLLVVVICPLFSADDGKIILQAHMDADSDGQLLTGFGRGIGTYLVSMMTTPLIGGIGMLTLSYTEKAPIPTTRLRTALNFCQSTDDLLLYKSQYEERLTSIQRRRNGNGAWVGAGLAGVTYILVALIVTAVSN